MHYIVFDLEFNQDFDSLQSTGEGKTYYPFEIIQIGAIKLDNSFNTVATFNRYIKPSIYSQISTFITELTGITTEQLTIEKPFSQVLKDYIEFIGEGDIILCTWGMSDIKELYRNAEYHNLNKIHLPNMYINLQPYVSTHLNLPKTKLIGLQAATEALNINPLYQFHNALYDAYYTAEILKALDIVAVQPIRYNPNYVKIRPRQPKKVIDFDKLIQQFEKMYARELMTEEKEMIMLAYKMGKTNQFIK